MKESNSSIILLCKDISKCYDNYCVFNDFNLDIHNGEIVSIIGPSGSGKSTLLHIIALLDVPSSGSVTTPLFKEKDYASIRKNHIGFIYQYHFLIDELTILENIMISYDKKDVSYALKILDSLNILDKKDSFPYQLSGGQKQRSAIARAIINCPNIIIADEPTGNLDKDNAENVQNILISYTKENGSTLIFATHDNNFAKKADRIICLR